MNFFTHKKIDVTFTKGAQAGTFTESGTNTVKLSGLRVSATIIRAGGQYQGALEMRIWGLTLSKMNDLATLGYRMEPQPTLLDNTVLVEAGDAETGMSEVFYGTIYAAWCDFMGMPDNPFNVMAYLGVDANLHPVKPTSYRGLTDVADILRGMADLAHYKFVNNGVTGQLENVYYPGTALEQIERLCEHANIEFALDGTTLTAWMKGGSRSSKKILLSPDSGLIGYPTFSANGIVATCYFNPTINYYGQLVQIKSDLPAANKTWQVLTLSHTIEAEVPRGHWITRFEAMLPGAQAPLV